MIGECVTRMCHAVEQFGGDVQSHMGDGIAAFFGVPAAHEDDPERAARAAIRILDVVGDYAREVEAAWGISDFSARVGINTGEVAVGIVGAADPRAVTLGDTANVAARLQSAAEPGSAVVGEATAKSILNRFELEPLGEVQVKGRIQAVGLWRLIGLQASTQAAPLSPLIGRTDEMQRLSTILNELVVRPRAGAADGRGRRHRQDAPAGRAAQRLRRPGLVAGGRMPLVRHRIPLLAVHRDAAQVDRRRGGRGRPGDPHEAAREARAPAGVAGGGGPPVPRAPHGHPARRRRGRQPAPPQSRGARREASPRLRHLGRGARLAGAGGDRGRGHALGRSVHARTGRGSARARGFRADPPDRDVAHRPAVRGLEAACARAAGLPPPRRRRPRSGRSTTMPPSSSSPRGRRARSWTRRSWRRSSWAPRATRSTSRSC